MQDSEDMTDGVERPPERCWWIEPGKVLGGPFPGHLDLAIARDGMARLLDLGIEVIVDLTEDEETNRRNEETYLPYSDLLKEVAEEREITVSRKQFFVTEQKTPRSNDEMLEILNFVNEQVSQKRKVYLHCAGGHGRTGTVAACWLMCRGLAFGREHALKLIATARQHDDYLDDHPSPENLEQLEFLSKWEQAMERKQWQKDARLPDKVHLFEEVDMTNPMVFAIAYQHAAAPYAVINQNRNVHPCSWVAGKGSNSLTDFTGWATGPYSLVHFRGGKPDGLGYITDKYLCSAPSPIMAEVIREAQYLRNKEDSYSVFAIRRQGLFNDGKLVEFHDLEYGMVCKYGYYENGDLKSVEYAKLKKGDYGYRPGFSNAKIVGRDHYSYKNGKLSHRQTTVTKNLEETFWETFVSPLDESDSFKVILRTRVGNKLHEFLLKLPAEHDFLAPVRYSFHRQGIAHPKEHPDPPLRDFGFDPQKIWELLSGVKPKDDLRDFKPRFHRYRALSESKQLLLECKVDEENGSVQLRRFHDQVEILNCKYDREGKIDGESSEGT